MKHKFFIKASILLTLLTVDPHIGQSQWVFSGLSGDLIRSIGSIGGNVLASGDDGLAISSDTGVNWSTIAAWQGGEVAGFVVNGSNIYAIAYGLYLSTDSGTNWVGINAGLGKDSIRVVGLVFDSENSYAVTGNGEIYLSTNNGTNWKLIIPPSPDSINLWSVAMDGSNIVGGTLQNGAYIFSFADSSWTTLNTGLQDVLAIRQSVTYEGHVFGIAFDGTDITRVFELADNTRWNPSLSYDGSDFTDVGTFVVCDGLLLADAWPDGQVFFFNDTTARWSTLIEGYYTLAGGPFGLTGNNIFASATSDQHGGIYKYSLSGSTLSSVKNSSSITSSLSLSSYPNPITSATTISFTLPSASQVTLTLTDAAGREWPLMPAQYLFSGQHEVSWDGSNYPSGVYLCRLEACGMSATQRVVVMH